MNPDRPTVRLSPALHAALRERAEATARSVSDLVEEAVRALLAEDAEDLEALRERRDEPTAPLDELVRGLADRGAL